MTNTPIVLLGALDSKGLEYKFLRDAIVRHGADTLTVNFGIFGSTDGLKVDVDAEEVARAGGGNLTDLRSHADRGAAMKIMAVGVAAIARQLYDEGKLAGIIGMGGSGGTSVITSAMRALPTGVPKVCVSTVAGGDVHAYVGVKDITLIPSVVDVAGLNRISRTIFTRAAGAIVGMVRAETPKAGGDRPIVVASMFGNTTECVNACRELLEATGYEVLTFHATGIGGRTMESLIDEGLIDACLDITTTEWADELCGGVFQRRRRSPVGTWSSRHPSPDRARLHRYGQLWPIGNGSAKIPRRREKILRLESCRDLDANERGREPSAGRDLC